MSVTYTVKKLNIKFILLIFLTFLIFCREAATCIRSPKRLRHKDGPTCWMTFFTPLLLCWDLFVTFLPSQPPVPLGVLPSSRIHPNRHFFHLSSSSSLVGPTDLVTVSYLNDHAMSLIYTKTCTCVARFPYFIMMRVLVSSVLPMAIFSWPANNHVLLLMSSQVLVSLLRHYQ